MKAMKKLLSMLLLAAMCLSLLGTSAYAADMGGEILVTADMMKSDSVSSGGGDVQAVQEEGEAVVIQANASAAVGSAQKQAAVVVTHSDGSESYYDGLPAALSAAVDGDVFKLNYNPSYGITLSISKKITVLLNGHTINVSVSGVNPGISAQGVTFRGGSIIINASPVAVKENEEPPVYSAGLVGSATLDNVAFTYAGPGRMASGSITVFGGSFSSDPSAFLPAGFEAYEADGRYKIREIVVEEPAETEETAEEPAEEAVEEVAAEEPAAEGEEIPAEEPTAETVETFITEEPLEEAAEEPAEGEEASEQPSEEAAEEPAEEEPAEEASEEPAEESAEEPASEEEGEQSAQETTETEKEPGLLEQLAGFITGESNEDVDVEAQHMEHNSDKMATVANITVLVSGAPDEAELTASATEVDVEAVVAAAGDVVVFLALDVNLSGELTEPVTVTLSGDAFVDISPEAELYHIKGDGSAEKVESAVFDPVNGSVSFQASEFSPYVVVVPDEMPVEDEDDNTLLRVTRDIGNTVELSGGGIQAAMDALVDDGTISLKVNAPWDVTSWPVGVNKVTLVPNGHQITTNDITIPNGKTLVINGASGNNLQDADTRNIVVGSGGTLILTGTLNVNGGITSDGDLQVIGRNVKVKGAINASSGTISVEGGSFGPISGGATGGITGGTYKNQVPAGMLTSGYQCLGSGESWTVNGMAKVQSADHSKDYYRGGQYVLQYGKDGSLKNYDYKFSTSPKGQLSSITLVSGSYSGAMSYDTDTTSETLYDLITIPQSAANIGVLENAPVGRAYFQFAFATTTIEVPVNIYPNVSYTPKYYYYGTYTPVVFTLTSHSGPEMDDPAYITIDFKSGDVYSKILPTTAYTEDMTGGTITLLPAYLETLTPGEHVISLWYDTVEGNKAIEYRCPIYVYKDYRVTQINAVNMYKEGDLADVNWYQYSGKNLSFTVNGDVSKFAGVRVDGKVVPAGNYSWASGGTGFTNVQLYPGYLATLAQGKHTVEFVYTDGVAMAEISILSASASPKTGDNNHIGLWIGVLVLSGAAVVALIPKKKKQ